MGKKPEQIDYPYQEIKKDRGYTLFGKQIYF